MKSHHIIITIILLAIVFVNLPGITVAASQAPMSGQAKYIQSAEAEDTVVYITDTGKKYHREGCRFLRKSKIKTTLAKAVEAGYKPCKVCKPPTL